MSIEYNSSEFISLAFTAKKLSNPLSVTKEDYLNDVISVWQKIPDIHLQEPFYELDSKGQLHIHGIITVKKHFYKKRLRINDYHIYIKDIYDIDQWISYISKQQKLHIKTTYLF